MTKSLEYCYCTRIGVPARKFITNPIVTAIVGSYMNTPVSRRHIDGFVKRNGIDLSEYEDARYESFNDFFTRKIDPATRPVDMTPEHLIAPCDGNLSAYRISGDSVFSIKNSEYNISDLVGGADIGNEYLNGVCLVFRLGVDNYHRYCYIDDGIKSRNYHIDGRYNPVQPIVIRRHPVFAQNTREFTVMDTKHFGRVTQIEVGACLVGRIKNLHEAGIMHRGVEKGMFLFGGSTIVLLLKENAVRLPEELFRCTKRGEERLIKYGQMIGEANG